VCSCIYIYIIYSWIYIYICVKTTICFKIIWKITQNRALDWTELCVIRTLDSDWSKPGTKDPKPMVQSYSLDPRYTDTDPGSGPAVTSLRAWRHRRPLQHLLYHRCWWVRICSTRLCLCFDFLWQMGHSNFGSTPHSKRTCRLRLCGRA